MGDVRAAVPLKASRIVPEPPTPLAAGAESLDVWGFRDSGFEVERGGPGRVPRLALRDQRQGDPEPAALGRGHPRA